MRNESCLHKFVQSYKLKKVVNCDSYFDVISVLQNTSKLRFCQPKSNIDLVRYLSIDIRFRKKLPSNNYELLRLLWLLFNRYLRLIAILITNPASMCKSKGKVSYGM